MEKFKKILLSFFVVFISTTYIIFQQTESSIANSSESTSIVPVRENSKSPDTQPQTITNVARATSITPSTTLVKKVDAQLKQTTEGPQQPKTVTSKPTPVAISKPVPTPTSIKKSTQNLTPKPDGKYINGTYIGNPTNAYYGTVQVKTTITQGKLAVVDFLKYPNNRSTSVRINSIAMPRLKTEAIKAQDANVSGVSGATYTSNAFRKSLADALNQAKTI